MRGTAGVLAGVILAAAAATGQPVAPSPAADNTRAKLLKVKLSVNFARMPLRDALKELAHLVDLATERPIFWTYTVEGPAAVPNPMVTYNCKDKAVEQILDDLFRPHNLGFTVLSQDDEPKDGWVRVAPGKERGALARIAPAVPSPAEVEDAAEDAARARLTAAKSLIDQGKANDAKLILGVITTKYGKTKAAAEAKALLEKLNP